MPYSNQELRLAIKQATQEEVLYLDIYLERKTASSEKNYTDSMGSTQILLDMAADRKLELYY